MVVRGNVIGLVPLVRRLVSGSGFPALSTRDGVVYWGDLSASVLREDGTFVFDIVQMFGFGSDAGRQFVVAAVIPFFQYLRSYLGMYSERYNDLADPEWVFGPFSRRDAVLYEKWMDPQWMEEYIAEVVDESLHVGVVGPSLKSPEHGVYVFELEV